MKKMPHFSACISYRKSFLLLSFIIFFSSATQKIQAQEYVVSYKEFYDSLAPYGQWIEDSTYGYAWVPNVDEDFQPYWTNGYWVLTEYGNLWVSDYEWGWACFHYGRWTYTNYYGWIWLPGHEWSPGWVAWRLGDEYCGWAPLYFDFDWSSGKKFKCPGDWWTFIPPAKLYAKQYASMYRGFTTRSWRQTKAIIDKTKMITSNFPIKKNSYSGPGMNEMQEVVRHPLHAYSLDYSTKPGHDYVKHDVVFTYRPKMKLLANDSYRPKPPGFIFAPQPIPAPEEIGPRHTHQCDFKENLQTAYPAWAHLVLHDTPEYNRDVPENERPKHEKPKRKR